MLRNNPGAIESGEKYANFINHMGIMQQRTIQQGDKNSVATQQRTMQHHLREHWGKNVTVYVDDMPTYDQKPDMSPYSHCQAVRRILLIATQFLSLLNCTLLHNPHMADT